MNPYADHMTENQIRDEIAKLEKVLNEGNATLSQASRLDELRIAAKRIRQTKQSVRWL